MNGKDNGSFICFFYRFFHAAILSGIMLVSLSSFLEVEDISWKQGILTCLLAALFSFLKILEQRQQIYLWLSGIFILAFSPVIFGMEKCLTWIVGEKSLVCTIGIVALICILQLLTKKYFLLKMIPAVAAGSWLICAMLLKRQIPQLGVALVALYESLILAQWTQITWKKKKTESSYVFIFWIIPFFILYFLFLCLLPTPERPYDWKWARKLYRNVEDKVTMCFENLVNIGSEDFGNAVSGFSDETGFFSGMIRNKKQLMKIKTVNSGETAFYLTGRVYDFFDGNKWESLEEGESGERLFDTLETVCAIKQYAPGSEGYYYKNVQMEVEYRSFHTNYLLAPSKTWKAGDKEKRANYYQNGTDYLFYKKAGYGTKYGVNFCQLNMKREELQSFLEEPYLEDETMWNNTVENYTEEKITVDELILYRDRIKKQYWKEIPINPRVEEWIHTVTQNAETDEEKLFYLEEALNNMQYHSKPGGLPETVTDEDSFLTYFLLEKQEGYCVHFATAFVLLARIEGFPARYVQGFCVPAQKEIMVTSDMAHAWAEVYIEGKGWIPFEATPGYSTKRYAAEENTPDTGYRPVHQDEEISRPDLPLETDRKVYAVEENNKRKDRFIKGAAYTGKIVVFILLVSILMFVADKIRERYLEKRRNPVEKFRIAVYQNLQILSMLGYERGWAETFHELTERIRQSDEPCSKVPIAFIESYENNLYGTEECTEETLLECLKQKKILLCTLKEKKGRKYLLYMIKLYFQINLAGSRQIR